MLMAMNSIGLSDLMDKITIKKTESYPRDGIA